MKFALILLFILSPLSAFAASNAPEGLWVTENEQAVIRIEKCGSELCGYLHWIKNPERIYDDKNPDPSKHKDPLCGLKMMTDFTADADEAGVWSGGNLYKSDEGSMYSGTITVISEDELEVRGFVGLSLFGKSQTWKRVSAKQYPACKKP